jgi:hypothetical protein
MYGFSMPRYLLFPLKEKSLFLLLYFVKPRVLFNAVSRQEYRLCALTNRSHIPTLVLSYACHLFGSVELPLYVK